MSAFDFECVTIPNAACRDERVSIRVGAPMREMDGLWSCRFVLTPENDVPFEGLACNVAPFNALVDAMQAVRVNLEEKIDDFEIEGQPLWSALPSCVCVITEELRIEHEYILDRIEKKYATNKMRSIMSVLLDSGEGGKRIVEALDALCETKLIFEKAGDAIGSISISFPKRSLGGGWRVETLLVCRNVTRRYEHTAPTPTQAVIVGLTHLRRGVEALDGVYSVEDDLLINYALPRHMPIELGSEAVLEATYYTNKRKILELSALEKRNR